MEAGCIAKEAIRLFQELRKGQPTAARSSCDAPYRSFQVDKPCQRLAAVVSYKIMPNRSSKKKPRLPDPNQLAFGIVQAIAGETPAEQPAQDEGKNPNAVALGRLGGLKGGKARAAKLSKKQRSAIAKKAAAARWKTS